MPTLKPRITITVSENAYEVITRMAKLQGTSKSKVVGDLLDSVAPALTRTVALLEAAADAPKQVRDGLRSVVESTHDELVGVSGDALKQLDFLLGAFSQDEANPHVVTRGSGLIDTPPIQGVKTKRKPVTTRDSAKSKTSSSMGAKDAGKKRKI